MPASAQIITFPIPAQNAALRRPAVLIRAAHEGQAGWNHDRDLRRLGASPQPGRAMAWLRRQEEDLNTARLLRDPDYDMRRHVLLMIALLAEMRHCHAAASSGRRTSKTSLRQINPTPASSS